MGVCGKYSWKQDGTANSASSALPAWLLFLRGYFFEISGVQWIHFVLRPGRCSFFFLLMCPLLAVCWLVLALWARRVPLGPLPSCL